MTELLSMRLVARDATERELVSPTVGIFSPEVEVGELVSPGKAIGSISVLGVPRRLCVPDGVTGRITSIAGEGRARVPVQYGDLLVALTTSANTDDVAVMDEETGPVDSEVSFVAPMSGRFYGRPSPNEEAFVRDGDTIRKGQTIGLLEVMKTFNRLIYDGDSLPDPATVGRVVPGDGDDVRQGDVILALEPPE